MAIYAAALSIKEENRLKKQLLTGDNDDEEQEPEVPTSFCPFFWSTAQRSGKSPLPSAFSGARLLTGQAEFPAADEGRECKARPL